MRVLFAPDSFGGTLTAPEAAAAMVAGWRRVVPGLAVDVLPLTDGGEGMLAALQAGALQDAVEHDLEVADPRGLVTTARWLEAGDGTAVVESAQACGLALLAPERRDPRRTTTWGVGQLLEAARAAGATRILVGLGGSATVDGGAGALSGLGFRLTVADGSGLKVGGQDLPRVRGAAPTWVADWDGVDVVLLADVADPLSAAPARYGPQKGADEATVAHLEDGLAAWREVAERDLGAAPGLAEQPGSGAAGGLGYGLAAGLGGELVAGARVLAELQGLGRALAPGTAPDLVVTGEGQLDDGSTAGKVVGTVLEMAREAGVPVAAVVGRVAGDVGGLVDVEAAAPDGPGDDPAAELTAAAERLAGRWVRRSG